MNKEVKLPNFLCVGAQKAGSTLLFYLLRQHPEIFLTKGKEKHFFNRDENYNKGVEWYSEFFVGSETYKAVGEATPEYNYYEAAPRRIFETLGRDVKIIFMLRNPADRAYSQYWMSFRRGHERRSFEDAIILEWDRIEKGEYEKKHFGYVSRGLYARQIKRYQECFPKENVKVFIFEEFSKDVKNNIKGVFEFLGCSADVEIDVAEEKVHQGDLNLPQYIKAVTRNKNVNWSDIPKLLMNKKVDYLPMKKETRHFLREFYREDINELEKLLGRNDLADMWFPGLR